VSKQTFFIGVAGNIGVGKTTLTKIIAHELDWQAYYESVIDNPYLNDFYQDMKRWSFNLQIYFLSHRFKTHKKMTEGNQSTVQDRTIYEDVEIFARNLYEMGNMSQRDWNNYRELFNIMTQYLKRPDLIVYLKASIDTLLTRIRKRSRQFERDIDPEYLHRLNISYDRWIKKECEKGNVLIIDTDNFNVFEDQAYLEKIIDTMKHQCLKQSQPGSVTKM